MAYAKRLKDAVVKVSNVPLLTAVAARAKVPFSELLVKYFHETTSVAPFQLA